MKKYLIPHEGQFYKANLHCHTTISDGGMTPQEVKDYYKERGYSVVAYTDHCIMLPHHDLTDESFLALTGYENEQLINQKEPVPRRKDCHICYIAMKKDNITMPYYLPRSIWGNGKLLKDQVKFNYDHTLDTWGYGAEYTNRNIALAQEQGFFVTYNHPAWSAEHYEDYIQYTGMNAMEIFNYASWVEGYPEYVPHVYDEFLRKGKRIYAIATDDNHSAKSSCGGWTMIKADKLEYETITDALVKGHFYASSGPEIHELWLEDNQVHVTCSPAKRVLCSFPDRRCLIVKAKGGELVQEAVFTVDASDTYFRITVVDENDRCADTNAYFTDELFEA